MAMTSLVDGSTKYHNACVIPRSPLPSDWVATLYSAETANGTETCLTAREAAAQAAGYWDPQRVGYCAGTRPSCDLGAKRVTLSMTRTPDGSVKYQNLCVMPQMLEDGTRSAASFDDGRTLLVYAHQDDDLLWMLPFWPHASQILLAAYPKNPAYESIVAEHEPAYGARWVSIWGRSDEQTFSSTYLDPCIRDGIVEAALTARLEPYLAASHVARVITHNPWGEYGHAQHRRIGKVVRALAVKYGKDVWALAVQASTPTAATRRLPGCGLPTVKAHFDHGELVRLRRVYQQTTITHAGATLDLWTWHDGGMDYPAGQRSYVMLVDQGTDLTANNDAVAQLEASVPLSGHCP